MLSFAFLDLISCEFISLILLYRVNICLSHALGHVKIFPPLTDNKVCHTQTFSPSLPASPFCFAEFVWCHFMMAASVLHIWIWRDNFYSHLFFLHNLQLVYHCLSMLQTLPVYLKNKMSKACDPGTQRVRVTFDWYFICDKVTYFAYQNWFLCMFANRLFITIFLLLEIWTYYF